MCLSSLFVTLWLVVLALGVGVALGLMVGRLVRPGSGTSSPDGPDIGSAPATSPLAGAGPVSADDAPRGVGGFGQESQPDLLDRILTALPEAALLMEADSGLVLRASRPAIGLGLVAGNRLAPPELSQLIRELDPATGVSEREVLLSRSSRTRATVELQVRAVRIPPDRLLLLIQDLSTTRRLDQVRRDFVANVSHELKTPVGAMSLLAEAVDMAAEDPDNVRFFAGRIAHETSRLASLVNDLIDLNRIQGEDALRHADFVAVDDVVDEAIAAIRLVSRNKGIEVAVGGAPGLTVLGIPSQIVTAVRNLLVNAIAYSPAGTRVAVATGRRGNEVEISVTDQGIGIPEVDQERIFERFYRVDQARSRATGGTGLGLSIVKHVCQNHGGSVAVWSREGAGSTFTLRFPAVQGPNGRAVPAGMTNGQSGFRSGAVPGSATAVRS